MIKKIQNLWFPGLSVCEKLRVSYHLLNSTKNSLLNSTAFAKQVVQMLNCTETFLPGIGKNWEKYFLAGKNRNCIGNLTLLFFDPHFWFRSLIVRCTKNLRYELVDVKSRLLPIGNRLVFCPFYGEPRDHPRLPKRPLALFYV